MKIKYKIIIIFIIITIITLTISNVALAWGINDINTNPSNEFDNVGNSVIKVLSTIGAIVSVATIIILGIKYMMGSLEERAEYKKSMLPYVIGSVFVFAASIIAQIIYDIAIGLE